MDQVNKPKKPLIYYYAVVMLVLALLNLLFVPAYNEAKVEEVSYSTFIQETEDKEIKEVQITSEEILFTTKTDGDSKVYKTGLMDDPGLTERLY
ncbi:MAG: ATP-dependent metallopeptidase FtsH/Yme1/Tma family protein, partial [Bulleidia sp.]